MSIDNISEADAIRMFADDFAVRRYEDEVLYPGPFSVTEEEKSMISRVLDARCRPARDVYGRLEDFIASRQAEFFSFRSADLRMAAATGIAAGEKKHYEDVRFVFVSEAGFPDEKAWKAVLEIPGEAGGGSMLALKVFGRDGLPAGDGLFTVAGTTVPVENGLANMLLDLFLVGIRDSAVSFQREGDVPVAGNLVFF